MKYAVKLLSILVIFLLCTSQKGRDKIEIMGNSELPVLTKEIHPVPKPVKRINKLTYEQFTEELARLETGGLKNPYQAVNQYGYLGKYQFSIKTLKGLVKSGYLKASKSELRNFKNLPELQERAIEALIEHNIDVLKRYGLEKYVGKTIGGVTITMEGMLAGAHLLGPYAVKHYLNTGGSMKTVRVGNVLIRKYDGNGTSIKTYMNKFEYV